MREEQAEAKAKRRLGAEAPAVERSTPKHLAARCLECERSRREVEALRAALECKSSNAVSNKSNGFDKVAYQRDYMRKRRAEAKR
jgi:hypothetical protein